MKTHFIRIGHTILFTMLMMILPFVMQAQKIIINEIMYNPSDELGNDSIFEYIELYNADTLDFDLSGWSFTEGIGFVFPQGTSLEAGGYLVIARDPDSIMSFYAISNVVGPFSDSLTNVGEELELSNDMDDVIDFMKYSSSGDWPQEPDGSGPSLELVDPDTDNNVPGNWAASNLDNGTPGYVNSVTFQEPVIIVISPNGGEYWERGGEYPVTWTSDDMVTAVRIELLKGGEVSEVLADSTENTGSWTWSIPEDQPAGTDYRILISDEEDGDPADESNNDFAVILPEGISSLVITEIMYHPPEGENDNIEFVEVFNNYGAPVNLENFYFSDGIEYVFSDTLLAPGNYIVITQNSEDFESIFGYAPFEWTSGFLDNAGEAVILRDTLDALIDSVYYGNELPWDTLAGGYGPSLTLCDPSEDNSLPESWVASTDLAAITQEGDTIYATPGGGCGSMAPIADFAADATVIYQGEGIYFTDLTANNPTHWLWYFPGGEPDISTEQNPGPVVYETPGLYDVKLIAYNVNGTDTLLREDYIQVLYIDNTPHAAFAAGDTMIHVGTAVDFTDLSANEPTTWSWWFPGGTPSSSDEQDPSGILYSVPGLYSVQLIVTNQYGEDSLTKEAYIAVFDTVPGNLVITEIMYNPPETGTDSLEFIEIHNRGETPFVLKNLRFTEGIDFTFPASILPPYDFQVIAADSAAMLTTFGIHALQWDEGALSNSGEDIELTDHFGGIVDYVEYDDEAPWPLESDGGGPSLTLCLPEEDNSLPENWQACFEFAAVNATGDTIWATPGKGCATPPTVDFIADLTAVAPGSYINFFDLSTGQPTAWEWSFVGGVPESSTAKHPDSIYYSTAGIYTVSLEVSNDYGADAVTKFGYIIVGFAPEAEFEADETEIDAGSDVAFTDLSTGFPLSFWSWQFEGGVPETSVEQNPVIIYPDAGDFDVTLTVINVFGESVALKTDYIHVGPLGMEKMEADPLVSVYPNPTDGIIQICSSHIPARIEVINLLGESVSQSVLTEPTATLDLRSLQKGVYFVVFHSEGTPQVTPVKLMIH